MIDWIDSVARRAGSSPEEVQGVLAEAGVAALEIPPRPHPLRITHIEFAGIKSLEAHHEPFEFKWDLQGGIWAVASDDDNFVGKSTVLEVVRWALRGRADLQQDVKSWMQHVEVAGSIDGQPFVVEFDLDSGEPVGRLVAESSLPFSGARAFENVVSAYMTRRLELIPLPFWQRRPGDPENRDRRLLQWGGYSGILFISPANSNVLLGNEVMGGIAGRLLQVFIALPWSETSIVAEAAREELDQQIRVASRRANEDQKAREEAVKELSLKRDRAVSDLANLTLVDPKELEEALSASRAAAQRVQQAQEAVSVVTAEHRDVEAALIADRRSLQDIVEDQRARRFFQALEPTMCPRCDHPIDRDRQRREPEDHMCSVCGEHVDFGEDAQEQLDQTKGRVEASTSHEEELGTRLAELKLELSQAQVAMHSSTERVDHLSALRASIAERQAAEIELARVEGALAERSATAAIAVRSSEQDDRSHILAAASIEAQSRLAGSQTEVFEQLNREIVDLGHRFGIEALEQVRITRAAQLSVTKGGQTTAFSNLTAGERLRLKIATSIALLRLGHRLNIGRHPGLLLLDSPGGEETGSEDISAILKALVELSNELPVLQVIAATARADLARPQIAADHLRIAPKGGYLW